MSLVVLIYHTLFANEQEYAALLEEERPYAISTEQFHRHLILLKAHKITIINPLDLFQDHISAEHPLFTKPCVLLTFDDGHHSHYQHALPILKQHGCSAVFFIITALPNHDIRYCNWRELTEMAEQGMSIQAHGHTHHYFADMGRNYAVDELKKTTQLLSEHLEQAPIALSFPGGSYLRRDLELASNYGLSYLFTSDIGSIPGAQWRPGKALPRLTVYAHDNDKNYVRQASGNKLYLLSRWCRYRAEHFRKKNKR